MPTQPSTPAFLAETPAASVTSADVTSDLVLVIAVDTSTPAVTAGVVSLDDAGPRVLVERVAVNPRAHGELLMPQLVELMAESGHQLTAIDAVVVGAGPGPFTGLRVGMVTAAALGHAVDRPVHPVCGLDAIAAQVTEPEPLLVATDARRKEVYWAAYDADRTRLAGPEVDRPEEVAAQVAERHLTLAAGEMARAHQETFGTRIAAVDHPGPAGLVAVAAGALRADREPEPLVPKYLRRPDAQPPAARKRVSPPGTR